MPVGGPDRRRDALDEEMSFDDGSMIDAMIHCFWIAMVGMDMNGRIDNSAT